MKNKIFSIMLCVLLFVSMFDCLALNVYAEDDNIVMTEFENKFNYYHPNGYDNVALLTINTSKTLFFTKNKHSLVIDGYDVYAVEEDGTTKAECYYLELKNISYWEVMNALTSEETVKKAKLKSVDTKLSYMGTKTWRFGNGTSTTIEGFAKKYYTLSRRDFEEEYTYYNEPSLFLLNSEYLLLKRPKDEKYMLIFRLKNGTHTSVDYSKFNIGKSGYQNAMIADLQTYYVYFDTIDEAYDYLFQDTSVSMKNRLYFLDETRPANSTRYAGTSPYYTIGDITSEAIIVNNTLQVYNSTSQTVIAEKNPASYSEWFKNKYGEDVKEEFKMDGEYYAIFRVPALKKDGVLNLQTVRDESLPQDAAGDTYILVATHGDSGSIFGTIASSLLNFLLSMNEPIVIDSVTNGMTMPIFQATQESPVTQYYFASAKEAAKFALYGSKAAMPGKIVKKDYVVNIQEVVYNNYSLGNKKWGINPIPSHLYEKNVEIHLKQHNAEYQVKVIFEKYEPGYVMLQKGYSDPYKQILTIANDTKHTWFHRYTGEEWEPVADITEFIQETGINFTKFPLYVEGMPNSTGTWDVIYSTTTIEGIDKNGNSVSVNKEDAPVQSFKNEDGKTATLNKDAGMIYVEGEEDDPYIWDEEKQAYVDKDGNIFDFEGWESDYDKWQEERDMYTESTLKSISKIISRLTEEIETMTKEIGEITSFLNGVLKKIPPIFRTLLTIGIIALAIKRVVKRES